MLDYLFSYSIINLKPIIVHLIIKFTELIISALIIEVIDVKDVNIINFIIYNLDHLFIMKNGLFTIANVIELIKGYDKFNLNY